MLDVAPVPGYSFAGPARGPVDDLVDVALRPVPYDLPDWRARAISGVKISGICVATSALTRIFAA